MEGLGRAGPVDLNLAMLRKAVTQVQVNEASVVFQDFGQRSKEASVFERASGVAERV